MTLLAFSRADDRDWVLFGNTPTPAETAALTGCLRPTRKCHSSSSACDGRLPSTAAAASCTATYEELLQVAPLGYLQVDEENQLLWCEQARQLLSLQRWERGQVRLAELVRSYELDQLIEQTASNSNER